MKLSVQIDPGPQSPREWDNLGTIWLPNRKYSLSDKDAHEPTEEDIAFPLFLDDCGRASLSTSFIYSKADGGRTADGWVYVSKEKALKEYGRKNLTQKLTEKIFKVIEKEIETYNLYLDGEVYYFVIEDENGNVVDSCSGFYGSDPKTNGMSDHINWKLLT